MNQHTKNCRSAISCIVVLGMHRSGTSLVAGLLQRLGVNMGVRFREPDVHNSDGYFEDLDWRDLNKEILRLTGCSWYRPPTSQQVLTVGEQVSTNIQSLVEMKGSTGQLTEQPTEQLWGWKDPRTCLTVELIHPYLFNPLYINVSRGRKAIVTSLEKRAKLRGYHEPRSHWYNLVDEYEERKFNFIVQNRVAFHSVSYDKLLSETDEVVGELAEMVGQKDGKIINSAANLVRKK